VSSSSLSSVSSSRDEEKDDDNDDVDDDSDNDELVAVAVIKEYWYATSKSKSKQYQRIFDVIFSDGQTLSLVAEQTGKKRKKNFIYFEQNSFYTEVVSTWRETHPTPPTRPQ